MVRVLFKSEALRDQCADPDAMKATWGTWGASLVRLLLQQLSVAESLDDLRFLPYATRRTNKGRLEVDVGDGLVVIMSDALEEAGQGKTQVALVESIRITQVQSA